MDFDILLKRKEAQLAPGQQYRLAWPGPAGRAVGSEADLPAPEQDPAEANTFVNLTTHDIRAPRGRPATPQVRAADEPDQPSGRQPSSPTKKRRTYLTKADWKTMDYQDTESE